jgi:hypothetical protein
MDITLLKAHVARAPHILRMAAKAYCAHPTERNACYLTGYIGALRDTRTMTNEDYSYWLAFIGHYEGHAEWADQAKAIIKEFA